MSKKIIILLIVIISSILILYMVINKTQPVVVETKAEIIHEPYVNEVVEKETITIEPTTAQVITDTEWNEDIQPICKSYKTSNKSNLTEKEINYILKDSYMKGMGWAFKQIEDTYGVNAVFALSVAQTETSFGKYGVANSCNNAFGLTNTDGDFICFDSIEDSILYFGAYIPRVHWNNNRYYIGDIAPVYCDYEWGDKVESGLDDIYDTAYSLR